jgi:DNA polymerase-3 subunit delta'
MDTLPWLAEPLARAIAQQRAHATLVHGPAGVGQFQFALALASAWLCEAGEGRPCGRCTSCRLMAAQAHPDFTLLVPEALRVPLGWPLPEHETSAERKDKKPSREIRVDAVRAAIDWGQQTSSRGGAKVGLLHPADAINPVAANALLKTLEEPPGALRLILCTGDPAGLLPTLRSRCQQIALTTPPRPAALAWLEGQGVDGADTLLTAAGGQPLLARAFAAEGLSAELWQDLPRLVRQGQAGPLLALPLPRLIDALQRLCHDLSLQAQGATARFFDQLPAGADPTTLAEWGSELRRAARHDEHPWNAGLLAEALLLAGRKACQINVSSPRPSPTLAAR